MSGPLDGDVINEALESLGATLALNGDHYEIVVIGGGNLVYAGLVERQTTRDIDILGQLSDGQVVKFRPLPTGFIRAAQQVARLLGLPPDWINIAPDALIDKGLPEGFVSRLEPEVYGGGLVVWFAARRDLIALKLYAAANPPANDPDHGRHRADLIDLAPSPSDLEFAFAWMTGFANPAELMRATEIVSTLQGEIGGAR